MAKAPKCKLCGTAHWLNQAHTNVAGVKRSPLVEPIVSRETIEPNISPEAEPVRYDWAARARELGLP